MTVISDAPIWHILNAEAPGEALKSTVLRREAWLPSFLVTADAIPAGPRDFHSGSVLEHLARCMDAVGGDALAVWMALTHDAGKLTTPAAMWPHHYGHEHRGEILADVWAQQLHLPKLWRLGGRTTALLHMKAGQYACLRPGTKYDMLAAVAKMGIFPAFWKVVDADTKSDISALAYTDWQKVCSLPYEDLPPDRARQRYIAALLP